EMSCKGWPQEAALRMLMNNLDPEVAERPDDLVVYGGTGRAARSWGGFDAIVDSLRALEADETRLVQSGEPVAAFRTHALGRRGDAGSAGVPGSAADVQWGWVGRAFHADGVTGPTSAHGPRGGYVPVDLDLAEAAALRSRAPQDYVRQAQASMAAQVEAMLAF